MSSEAPDCSRHTEPHSSVFVRCAPCRQLSAGRQHRGRPGHALHHGFARGVQGRPGVGGAEPGLRRGAYLPAFLPLLSQ